MMNIPDKRRATNAISIIKRDLFKDRYLNYVDPLVIPDFNSHIIPRKNRNRNANRSTRFGEYFDIGTTGRD